MGNSSSRSASPEVTNSGRRVTDGNIAAIDFGTTSASLAFTTKGDNKISVLPLGLEAGMKSLRVLNVILFSKKGDNVVVEAFGANARKRYRAMKQSDYLGDYIYFERIKMLMRREKVYSLVLCIDVSKLYCRQSHVRHKLSHFLARSSIWLKSLHSY